ncbi:MAG TPA: helix-turn-helix domain-containing protein [Burkholderiaceae bacterium]
MPSAIRTSGQLGPALRALRQRRGWSQTELGRRVGLSQERISSIERRPERITISQLLTVLMALDGELFVAARPTSPPPDSW